MMMEQIVITGAAGALGGAVARHLSKIGMTVIGLDLAATVENFPGSFIGNVDLTSPEGAASAFSGLGGTIKGLVNVAGGFRWETVADGSAETWETLYRMNVLTALNASKAALPKFAKPAAIVNVGAAATLKAGAGMGAYTASKSAVARLTESLAEELKPNGTRVNAVLPSIIDTPANRADMGEGDVPRWVTPDELARVIAFLLSENASGITGACLPVTGRL